MTKRLPSKFFIIYFSKICVGIGIGIFLIFILLSLWYSYTSALIAALPFLIMSAVPSFLSPFIGTQVDRHSKYMIGLISISLSIISLLPLYFAGNIFWIVMIFTLLIFFESYFNIDYTISVRNIVGDENLMYANNLWVASLGITYVIAYISGAYFYTYLSFTVALVIVTISYSTALILWFIAKVPDLKRRKEEKVKYSEIFKVLKEKPALFHLILIYDFIFLFVVATHIPAYIPYCFNLLKMSPFTYGIYNGLSAFIYAIVPLSIHRFIRSEKVKRYAVRSLLYEGILIIIIAFIPFIFFAPIYKITLFLILIVILAFPVTLELDSFLTLFQTSVPTTVLGRLSSVRSLFRGTINVSSILIAGYLTDIFGPIAIILFSGIFIMALIIPTKHVLDKL